MACDLSQARGAWPSEALGGDRQAQRRRRRNFLILALLYGGQAIPVYLVVMASLPIMREQGIRPSVIGLVGLLLIPTLLRFVWAPYIDRVRPVASAHRASWIAIGQAGVIGLLILLSFVPPWRTLPFLAISMGIAVLLATIDIAVDGYAARSLDPRDRPLGMPSRDPASPSASSSAVRAACWPIGISTGRRRRCSSPPSPACPWSPPG